MPASRVERPWRHVKPRRGALDQAEDEDALYAAAERNGLVSDPKDGLRKTWATIRSGLRAGLQQPKTLAPTTEHRGVGAAHEHHA